MKLTKLGLNRLNRALRGLNQSRFGSIGLILREKSVWREREHNLGGKYIKNHNHDGKLKMKNNNHNLGGKYMKIS